jgi:phosphosulfolactate synthase (CoM biosynthesis protein A)
VYKRSQPEGRNGKPGSKRIRAVKINAIAPLCCALIFTSIPVAGNAKDTEGLIGKCSSGDYLSCRRLERAVGKLTDQGLLAKIVVEVEDSDVREAAVKRLTDQAALARIAVEDKDSNVREAAVDKLTDQVALAKVAVEAKDSSVRWIAVGRLTDQAALAKVAVEVKDPFVGAKAIAAMDESNPALKRLAGNLDALYVDAPHSIARIKLAIHEPRIQSRLPGVVFTASVSGESQAYSKVWSYQKEVMLGESVSFVLAQHGETLVERKWSTDFPSVTRAFTFLPAEVHGEDLLADLLVSSYSTSNRPVFTPDDLAELSSAEIPEVRLAAVRNLTDQALLAKVAIGDEVWTIWKAAVEKLTDQAALAKVAVEAGDPHVREAAVEKLTDQVALAKVAVEAKDSSVRWIAVERLTDQVALAKVAVEARDPHVRIAAVEKLTDQALLAKIAVEDEAYYVRGAAVEKLTDQALLAKIAVEDEAYYVRGAAVERLTDQAALAKVAVEAKDPSFRKAAEKRLAQIRNSAK